METIKFLDFEVFGPSRDLQSREREKFTLIPVCGLTSFMLVKSLQMRCFIKHLRFYKEFDDATLRSYLIIPMALFLASIVNAI